MKVLVTGSRHFHNLQKVDDTLDRLLSQKRFEDAAERMGKPEVKIPPPFTVIQGGAIGVDARARHWAEWKEKHYEGVKSITIEPEFMDGYRDGVYLDRNDRMLDMLDKSEDMVLAFWNGDSTGTEYTIKGAFKRYIHTEVIF